MKSNTPSLTEAWLQTKTEIKSVNGDVEYMSQEWCSLAMKRFKQIAGLSPIMNEKHESLTSKIIRIIDENNKRIRSKS